MIEHTIYKEFFDRIAELSDGIYPIITDLDNDISYIEVEPGEHTCLFSTVISNVEYTLDRAKELHSPDLLFFNDMVMFNGSSHIDIMKIIHQSVINSCDGFFVEFQPI